MKSINKPKVAILSPTGLVGSALYEVFHSNYELGLVYRGENKLELLDKRYGGVEDHAKFQLDYADLYKEQLKSFHGNKHGKKLSELVEFLKDYDWIINASGIIKPFCDDMPDLAFYVNSVLPNILAEEFGNKLIQVTTDCVFNGTEGAPYDEESIKLPPDLYGATKMLGEPTKAIVLRFSTIGYELSGERGLLEWLISQKGKEVDGFTNHLWNGLSSREVAKAIQKIIDEVITPESGIYHIFSNDITKYDLLVQLNEVLDLGCKIIPTEAGVAVDRRLRTAKDLNQNLQISPLSQMTKELNPIKTTYR